MTIESTQRRFLRSSVASYTSVITRSVIAFGSRMLLARLVIDEGYGLYEEALSIVMIVGALRDFGLVHHLIRDPRRPYGTVFAFTLVSGLLFTTGLILGAPAFGLLNPELPAVLRVFAVWVLLDGLMYVPKTYFERELRIGRLLVPEILRSLVVALVAVVLAALGWGVWSLVAGELCAALLFAILLWRQAWGEITLNIDLQLLPDLLRKSSLLLMIWVTAQLIMRVDVLIIEVFSDPATVGQYGRAYWIVFLVPALVAPRALLPTLVEYRDDPPRFFQAFRIGVVLLLSFQVMAAYFLFFNAEKVISIFLGPGWAGAVPLLRILCFVPLVDIFADFGGEVLKVRNEDRLWMAAMLLNLLSLLVFGSLFTARWGAPGMAWANFLLLGNPLMIWRLSKILGPRFKLLVADLLLVYLVPLPFFLAPGLVFPADSWTRLFASLLAIALAAATLGARFYRPFRRFFAG